MPEVVPCPVPGCGRCMVQADAGDEEDRALVLLKMYSVSGAGEEAAGEKGRADGGAEEA